MSFQKSDKDVEYRGGPGAVAGSRVRHRVSMIPVGGNLKDKWALSQKNSGQSLFERLASRHCCKVTLAWTEQ